VATATSSRAAGEDGRDLTLSCDLLYRLDTIVDGGTLVDYEYKGLYLNRRGLGGAIDSDILRFTMKVDGDDEEEVASDLEGYDAWGRIDGMKHIDVSVPDDIVHYAYGYDRASNRTYQEDQINATSDELYGYDTVHRLVSFERGDLNEDKDAITGTAARQQAWTLDKQGNWNQIESDDGVSAGSPSDTRTHNKVNDDRASPSGRFAELAARRAPSSGGGAARTYDGNQREIVHGAAGNLSIVELDVSGGTSRWFWKNRAGCV